MSQLSVLGAAMVTGRVFHLNGLDAGLQTSKASMQRLHHVIGPGQVTQRCLVACISQGKRMEWIPYDSR